MAGTEIPYPMLTDVDGKISKQYEVYDEKSGTSLRGTFIIDHEGYVHGGEILTSPVGRSSDEILRQLKAFQEYSATKKLIPADWQPGDKTLSDSIELAGKVWTVWKPKG